MSEKHLSTQFDAELNHISGMVMEMGGLVEQQMRQAVEAMIDYNLAAVATVSENEPQVNAMELQIDHELVSIIGRRQPTARDLRLLIAISRIIANLERAGDEADRIARMVQRIITAGSGARCHRPNWALPHRWPRTCCARRWMPLPAWMSPLRWKSSRPTTLSTRNTTASCASW